MSWFGEAQWFILVSLFVAALVTLGVYLFQYILGGIWRLRGKFPSKAQSEADSLLSWILSLNSWRSQWLRAWINALNEEAGKRGGTLRLSFEDDNGQHPLELSVKEVTSVLKSDKEKVVSCSVIGDSIQFTVRVTRTVPANSGCQVYSVRVTPLQLNLELHVKEESSGSIRVLWTMGNFANLNLQVQPKSKIETPGASAVLEALEDILKNLMTLVQPSVDLSTRPTGNIYGASSQLMCPPKPPRVHDLKLQLKGIRATLSGDDLSGISSAACTVQINDPVQNVTTAASNTTSPSWEEEFIFELNAKSRELQLQIVETGKSSEGAPLASANVPLDLFHKQPSGRQSFPLRAASGKAVSGSVSAQFLYIEPIDGKSWTFPTPVAAKKVEKDRTVMPCGTVVTTVTSVTSKPRLDGKSPVQSYESPAKTPPKVKVIERDFSVQTMPSESMVVSKALSSSDTELLFLNGSDPVAEAAIRQLRESSKQSFKSPRKKSTIIISGISKTSVSQDEEVSLMLNYAEAMDNSVMNSPHSINENATPSSAADNDHLEFSVPTLPSPISEDGLLGTWEQGSELEEWNINGLEDPDCEGISISNLSVSETGSIKKSKGGFLKKGAKMFFRRRHQQKEPGMSQSQNDLVYLETARSGEHPKKGATLSRLLHRKRFKNKGKSPPQGTPTEN
ncbi:C2 domain-containing protein 2 [Xenopus laevis]|uniref:C2 domain-containing protein 2 n=2 Tax=Xenopus laevis TaxID=8355 RepID=A0A1L8HCD6_XENLA|nr:C2 domain-containing protein 2 [Xenopus laevis]XP_041437446.1 C2 domain-containing protein 2 [Xenopus laevis]OCT93716.1 hypothetical protein XELAEV_18011392mg [Xenopus laevis]